MRTIEYVNLEEVSHSDYKIADGQANITRWPVEDESGSSIGKVRDLLFDPVQQTIRYIIVDLDEEAIGIGEKAVLIPIGYAELGEEKKKVVLPVMDRTQYVAMPRYVIGEVTRKAEMEIRSAIGSPAALRIEEEIAEMDHEEFYKHHHFDRGIAQKATVAGASEDGQSITPGDREEERNTVHGLIDHAHNTQQQHDGLREPGSHESFIVQVGDSALTVEPLENGTYRVLENGEKLGVIYAEAGESGVQWNTMDELNGQFVEALGKAITEHNEH